MNDITVILLVQGIVLCAIGLLQYYMLRRLREIERNQRRR